MSGVGSVIGVPGFDSLEFVKRGSGVIDASAAVAGNTITTTIAHNLSFVPVPSGYMQVGSAYIQLPNFTGASSSGGNVVFNSWVWISTDQTNVYLNFLAGTTANWGTWNIVYYLGRNTAK